MFNVEYNRNGGLNLTESYVVGLMSGTSLDGIDAAVVKIVEDDNGIRLDPFHFLTLPYSADLKEKLLQLCDPDTARLEDLSAMNMLLGERFAEAALSAIKAAGLTQKDILLVSSHGQTVYHQPTPITIVGSEVTSTLQIGDIGVIAERTGIMTVGDFRTRDMAAGGQGAPLVPYADYLLFKKEDFGRVLVNIGGISNLTILPKNSSEKEVLAYDTGPGNMIIDSFTQWATDGKQTYDKDGAMAAKGSINQAWLNELVSHPYYFESPPKSTGRELFGIHYAKKLWKEAEDHSINHLDKIATVTELTAITVAIEINKFIEQASIEEVLISGGGRYNKTLMDRFTYHLPANITIQGTDEYGVPSDAKEAMVFALLGYQCYHKKTNNLPSATGANHPVIMGKIAW